MEYFLGNRMSGAARWLRCDVLVYWCYETGIRWISYPAKEQNAAPMTFVLFHIFLL